MYENYGWKYVLTAAITVLFGWALFTSPISLGIDLKGGSELLYRLDTSGAGGHLTSLDTDTTVQVLQNRLDALAIKEMSIRRQGALNIVIQVPGGDKEAVKQIKKTVETTGLLHFKLVVTPQQQEMGSPAAVDAMIQEVIRRKAEGVWVAYEDDAQAKAPDQYDVAYNKEDGRPMLLANKGVAGRLLKDAHRALDSAGRPAVGFTWGSQGRNKFYDMTSNNVGRQMAIVLDGVAQSAPSIRSAIGEQGIIEGGQQGFNDDEVKRLIVILKAGALPGKPIFEYGQEVGATLGQAAVTVGGIATAVSMLLVLGFMVFYYKQGGIIANVALVLNILLLLGTLAMFGATLTLPGIAGILLTAGMAVDANILIFERMREEKVRGADPKQVIEVAYDRAFWTIFDSHVTTLVTGLVLYWTGTGPIRGFAVTLIIGISISLFTSLFVTKMIYGWLGANDKLPPVNFRHLIENPHFDFMGFYPKAIAISLVLINIGFLAFISRGEKKYGIDFTGGTVLELRLKDPMEKHDLDERLNKADIKDYESQRVGEAVQGGTDKGDAFQIRTRLVAEQMKKGATGHGSEWSLVKPAYGQDGVGQPSTQTGTAAPNTGTTAQAQAPAPAANEKTAEEREGQDRFKNLILRLFEKELVTAFPAIEGSTAESPYRVEPAGDGRSKLHFYVNLLALEAGKKLTPEEVRATVKAELSKVATDPRSDKNMEETVRRQIASELSASDMAVASVTTLAGAQTRYQPFEVTTGPVTGAADRMPRAFTVVRRALDRNDVYTVADPLPRVESIGGAVAKNLKAKAFISMFAAIIAIVLYVAFRFEFIWGIGAILSLIHDLFTTIGFIALADLICSVLGLDFDAKINLPTVAAFLTLLGYSITDTIVVYDRIREKIHSHKLKHADAATINEAINSTLSRTILTSLTVFIVALVLFVCSFGDLKSIQGFSLAMTFGVATGTYSSIFVAAPVILSDPKKLGRLVMMEIAFIAVVGILASLALH
ncbi:MAG: protein translocase subunit SecD [Planctomycetota bacterium]